MNPQYLQDGMDANHGHAIEESGEVLEVMGRMLKAAGKCQRFGLESVNPELPKKKQRRNIETLDAELHDLEGAIRRLRGKIWDYEMEHNPKRRAVLEKAAAGDSDERRAF